MFLPASRGRYSPPPAWVAGLGLCVATASAGSASLVLANVVICSRLRVQLDLRGVPGEVCRRDRNRLERRRCLRSHPGCFASIIRARLTASRHDPSGARPDASQIGQFDATAAMKRTKASRAISAALCALIG